MNAFEKICTPGLNMFCTWGAAYAPPLKAAAAQLFLGEWTGTAKGADLIVARLDSDRQDIVGFDGIDRTQALCIDPYRPVVWMATRRGLYEIDRLTLKARVACEMPLQYTMDVDRKGRVWLAQTRSLRCFDPATSALTVYPDVTPDEYYYAEGTHMTHGVGADGRIWTNQFPIPCLAVFDPQTRETKIVWGEPGKPFDPRLRESGSAGDNARRVSGIPVAIGDLIWAGQLFADARTAELVEPPFPVVGDESYTLLMRGQWHRTPTALLDRQGSALVSQKRRIGFLEVNSGRFSVIGELPEGAPDRGDWSLHGDHTLVAADMQQDRYLRVDLKPPKTSYVQLRGPYKHAQAMFDWTVGPDNKFYGSCYSHDLWQVDRKGSFTNHGDVVRVHGGELHGFARWKNKLFIVSYTHSVLTRVDVTRPADHWGKQAEDNPRHILNLLLKHEGQHRPGPVVVTPRGEVCYVSRSDYCTRREGALVMVDAETEDVLTVVDPLVPGEQLWAIAASPTRPELYIGTGLGTFVVWNTRTRSIVRSFKFPFPETERVMTSSMIHIGGIRFMAAAGDLVIGNEWGSMNYFTYHADSGEMENPRPHPDGRVVGVYRWNARDSFVLYMDDKLVEMAADGSTRALYTGGLPGAYVKEGPDGRLYLSDSISIFGETAPLCEHGAATGTGGFKPA